jgi:hypothetical protein
MIGDDGRRRIDSEKIAEGLIKRLGRGLPGGGRVHQIVFGLVGDEHHLGQ